MRFVWLLRNPKKRKSRVLGSVRRRFLLPRPQTTKKSNPQFCSFSYPLSATKHPIRSKAREEDMLCIHLSTRRLMPIPKHISLYNIQASIFGLLYQVWPHLQFPTTPTKNLKKIKKNSSLKTSEKMRTRDTHIQRSMKNP